MHKNVQSSRKIRQHFTDTNMAAAVMIKSGNCQACQRQRYVDSRLCQRCDGAVQLLIVCLLY